MSENFNRNFCSFCYFSDNFVQLIGILYHDVIKHQDNIALSDSGSIGMATIMAIPVMSSVPTKTGIAPKAPDEPTWSARMWAITAESTEPWKALPQGAKASGSGRSWQKAARDCLLGLRGV